MKPSGLFNSIWRKAKRFFILLILAQFIYITVLKWVNPPITITQFISLTSSSGLSRDYVSMKAISPHIKLAVMAAEDQLFPDHNGFDIKSIQKAIKYNQDKTKRIKGASTISQQVAKNVFLWQGRSWFRKGLETYFTFMIEIIWGKERILDMYLNVIEMGDGIYGIEAASKKYFKKPSSKLLSGEAALIAAALPNPKKYKVMVPSKYLTDRSQWIMKQMNNLNGDPDIALLLGDNKYGTAKQR